ncbi:MAG: cation:proton antiporter subunit C [Rickettsiaceae bacterium H1]|nr:cation:proton antiporter subunit C [Rickettsiaceae bacterium H1]
MTQLIYCAILILMLSGLLIVIMHKNKFKRLFGLNIFQNSVLLFYIAVGFIDNASIPIYQGAEQIYSNPIPQVLMLTAIVVSVATTAVGLALIVKEKKQNSK